MSQVWHEDVFEIFKFTTQWYHTEPSSYNQNEISYFKNNVVNWIQLEQLERLHSEDTPPPPPPHDYPYHRVILDPKSKEDKVKATNLKN